MRNPNGFGSVIRLSGNRRRPYMARKTMGWNEKGHPIYRAIGYAETREQAIIMLADYNKSPYNLDARTVTVGGLFESWLEAQERSGNRAENTLKTAKNAFLHCKSVYTLPYREMRAYHVQQCMDSCGGSYSLKNNIRTLFVNLDKFALERDIVDKCYAALVESAPVPSTQKTVFSPEEIAKVWESSALPGMDTVIILLYSGWRISELLDLRKRDIDLTEKTMCGGAKTKNGKNRIVPIHPKILPFIQKRYGEATDKLFPESQSSVRKYFDLALAQIGCEHTPHECRHTFRSALDSAGANKVCIDLLMGHASQGTGERIYTHKTIDELRVTIRMLNY